MSLMGVASAAEALAAMGTKAFDLVLTDYHMPDATGFDFLKDVRALQEPTGSTPIIVVTADVMSFSAPSLREMGFAGALGKPVMAAAMRRVIASIAGATGEFIGDGFARARA